MGASASIASVPEVGKDVGKEGEKTDEKDKVETKTDEKVETKTEEGVKTNEEKVKTEEAKTYELNAKEKGEIDMQTAFYRNSREVAERLEQLMTEDPEKAAVVKAVIDAEVETFRARLEESKIEEEKYIKVLKERKALGAKFFPILRDLFYQLPCVKFLLNQEGVPSEKREVYGGAICWAVTKLVDGETPTLDQLYKYLEKADLDIFLGRTPVIPMEEIMEQFFAHGAVVEFAGNTYTGDSPDVAESLQKEKFPMGNYHVYFPHPAKEGKWLVYDMQINGGKNRVRDFTVTSPHLTSECFRFYRGDAKHFRNRQMLVIDSWIPNLKMIYRAGKLFKKGFNIKSKEEFLSMFGERVTTSTSRIVKKSSSPSSLNEFPASEKKIRVAKCEIIEVTLEFIKNDQDVQAFFAANNITFEEAFGPRSPN